MTPCYRVDIAGTTGAGDCTIAGFISGIIKRLPVEGVIKTAVGVGAFNVENHDATTGVPEWDVLQKRIKMGWESLPLRISLKD